MSDLPADTTDTPDESPPVHPALEAFKGILNTPEGQDWADEATQKIQAFENVRGIVDGAQAAAHEYVANIDSFKSGLVQMARNDPTTLPLALDLVPGTVKAMMPPDGQDHADPLTRHIQNQVAASGIQSLAIQDEAAARSALDLYGEHLSDEDTGHLSGFIDTMARARAADHAAQVMEETRRVGLASDTRAHGWLSQLNDPGTGDVRFPNNWMRDMIADPSIEPQTKAVLSQAHTRLMTQGDPMQSDPNTVVALLDRATGNNLTPTEVWSHAGADLSLADTQMLAGAAFPKTPEQLREVAGFAQTLASARSILASPENGLAGQRAFDDFVNWLMPEYRRAGPGSLDPRNKDWLLGENGSAIARFMPTGGDVLLGARRSAQDDATQMANTDRPTLAEIFGNRKTTGDEVIPAAPVLPVPIAKAPGRGEYVPDTQRQALDRNKIRGM